jgi:hypothetical protein
MEGADWLRTQLTAFSCTACGRPYRADRINVLAQREDLFFVRLACLGCGANSIAIVTIQVDGSEEARLDTGELAPPVNDDGREPEGPPVLGDDVLSMHVFLRGFDGDFHRLFRETDGSPGATGGQ